MPPKTAKKLLRNKLEDLSAENFKRFRTELVDRKDGVRMIQVEGKDVLEVSEVMINVYTERKALNVAEETLREIRCTQDADELAEHHGGLWGKPSRNIHPFSCTLFPSVGSGGVLVPISSQQEHFVDRHRDELIQRVTTVPSILDKLLKEKVIQAETYDEILSLRPTQAQMRRLYRDIGGGGSSAKDLFLQILKDQQRYLIDDLMKK
uniref:CARD domain-containing protein n=1 Tax=Poecilia reticulata TaxID=8081 RepID=A0A3P9N2N6_POERE